LARQNSLVNVVNQEHRIATDPDLLAFVLNSAMSDAVLKTFSCRFLVE
jgi:hypothetical protein